MNRLTIGRHEIGPDRAPYIVAEMCNNFGGDPKLARRMVEVAADCGVHACKFQMRLRPDRLSPKEHAALRDLTWKQGMDWFCTGYDHPSWMEVLRLNPAAVKVGSMEAREIPVIAALARQGKPMLLSTGGSNWCDIDAAAKVIPAEQLVLLQCTSIYPTPLRYVNLNVLPVFAARYKCLVGLSDHTPAIWTSLGAVAKGAVLIEKHFTLDRTLPGPDQRSSITPQQMRDLVAGSWAIWKAGGNEKCAYPEELKKFAEVKK